MKDKFSNELISRREMLKIGLGALGMVFINNSGILTYAAPVKTVSHSKSAKAKSIIQIWVWGGPSHLDTFDPKPDAGYNYCGPLNKPISTNVKGIQIGELLPLTAKQADKFSIIRGMTHGINSHETAAYLMQTGHDPSERLVYPCIGAVVSMLKGYDNGYNGMIPPYVVLTEAQGRFSESGFLGPKYKPFVTGGDPSQKRFAVSGIITEGVSDERQKNRRELLHNLDSVGNTVKSNPSFEKMDNCEEKAYSLILGEGSKVFDLSTEKDELRDKYGRNRFGQACLAARKLVEIGVPYITINYKGWDTHKRHFELMKQNLPIMDMGYSTLLQDLSDKGLLDSTIVWWGGEFGRTPKVQWEEPWNGGRGHYGNCFSVVLAGGGFKGGLVVGESDAKGEEVASRPVYPQDLIGSMYEQLGIDPDGTLPNPLGLNLQVMPSAEKSGKSKGRLREIM